MREFLGRRVICAPMAAVTSADFRYMVRKFTDTLVFSEMCSAHALVHNPNLLTARIYAWDHPIALQIYGANPGKMVEAAKIAEKLGADVLDINMGCARRIITKQGAGAAFLKKPEFARNLIRELIKNVSIPVSLKTRIGWDKFQPGFFEQISDCDLAFLTIHGRTARAGFSGDVDTGAIASVKKILSVPVVGNGNLFTPGKAVEMLEKTGCDAVMVARGMMGRPRFAEACINAVNGEPVREVSEEEIISDLLEHARKFCEINATTSLKKFRQHIYWYFKTFRKTPEFYDRIQKVNDYNHLEAFVEWFSGSVPSARENGSHQA
ncbi:MAG: tRNA-dihydrouridine synthase [Thermoplasmata archaeon]|nr:tRNA-dihydrouridine synthase [Thermoplasmata archaeon]